MRVIRSLILCVGLTLSAGAVAAQPRDGGATDPCAGVTQNELQVQFRPELGVRVDAAGHLLVRDPARLSTTQRRELAALQSIAGAAWRSEVDPATAAALRRQPADDPAAVGAALDELLAFARVAIGGAPQRGPAAVTGTSFDARPVMSRELCARTSATRARIAALGIVRQVYFPPLPAPPGGVP